MARIPRKQNKNDLHHLWLGAFAETLFFTCLLTLVFLFPGQAAAQTVFDEINNKICEIYGTVRIVVLGFGGFSGVVIGVMAMFGTVQWSKMFTLSAGLFIIVVADLIVTYLTNLDLTSCRTPMAIDDPLFQQVNAFIDITFLRVRVIAYSIAGLAAITLGVTAMFGQFAWRKFFGIIAGIGIIALIDSWISYLSDYITTFQDYK